MKTQNKFYVYAYLDPRKPGNYQYGSLKLQYEPFYIGKGSRDRCTIHLHDYYLKKNFNAFLNNKIRKIRRETSFDPIIIKLYDNVDEDAAFKKEVLLIGQIGRKIHNGPLTNIYDGGEGSSKSEETKQKISATKKAQYAQRGKESHPMYGKRHTEATKEKMRNRPKYKWTDEQKDKLSEIRCQKKPQHTRGWLVISPEGVETAVFGLGQFCRENNLSQPHMFEVATGNRSHHKKWKCRLLET